MKHKECFLNDSTCGPLNKATGKAVIKEAHILSQAATMKQLCGDVNGQKEVYKASTQKSVGWKKASAYHCFCGDHDTEIFKPIENDNSYNSSNEEQLFLHTFRAFAFEYHKKRIVMDSKYALAESLDNMVLSLTNLFKEEKDLKTETGFNLDHRHNEEMYSHDKIKQELIKAYKTRHYSLLLYKPFTFDVKFPFASAGTLLADILSTENTCIVYYNESEPQLARPGIMLTVFPDPKNDSTNIILACLKSDNNAVEYLNKYDSLNNKEIQLAVSSLMLTTNRDNTFFHPDFWRNIQKHPCKDDLYNELQKNRGFDLLNVKLKQSNFNLFDTNLINQKNKVDA
jgi:hypothetical protein